jgi:hypothetical protein
MVSMHPKVRFKGLYIHPFNHTLVRAGFTSKDWCLRNEFHYLLPLMLTKEFTHLFKLRDSLCQFDLIFKNNRYICTFIY